MEPTLDKGVERMALSVGFLPEDPEGRGGPFWFGCCFSDKIRRNGD